MEQNELKSKIESILFISGEPVKFSRIAKICEVELAEVQNAVMVLQEEYSRGRGISIIKKDDEAQIATSSENSDIVSKLVKSEMQENLSRASLEVLSIVAYRGPITKINIEAIRGVNSSFTLRALLMRGLIERADNPADSRSYLYKISFEFLKKLGFERVEKLPDWESLSQDKRIESVISQQQTNA